MHATPTHDHLLMVQKMTRPNCPMCEQPGRYPIREVHPKTRRTRKVWYCVAHWRERLGAVSDNVVTSDCGACKRLRRPCLDHVDTIPVADDTMQDELQRLMAAYERSRK